MKKLFSKTALVTALLALAVNLSACKGDSVVSDSSSKSASSQPAAQPASSPNTLSAASPNAAAQQVPQQNQPATPSPTILPIIKQAQAKPGVPVPVPESMKRPLTAEEMQKALQAMPPEVRARIQGMQAAPPGAKPQPTKKP
ncbi:MAG: hypothetical protein M3X11_26435 [Acidobacteriota bacterium]|nr:hypothetical protein [Acidobacteriota bacterium]